MSLPPTNAEIAYQQSGLLDRWTLFTTQLQDWLGGTADGGPNGDGSYPLQDRVGNVFMVPCSAAWAAQITSLTAQGTGAVDSAEAAEAGAQAAQTAAEAARDNALTYQTGAQSASGNASMYATNSANSAAAALSSKNAAASSETNAAASATAAATSETNAATSATAAATSATDADNDAVAADQSAQAAAASATQAAQSAAGKLAWFGVWDISGGTLPAAPASPGFYWITGTATINGEVYKDGDGLVWGTEGVWHHIDNQQTVASVAGLVGTITVAQLQASLNLGTAAYQPTTAFATAAQGAKADAAMPKAGGAFAGDISAPNVSASNTLFGNVVSIGTMTSVFTDIGGILKVSGEVAQRYANSPSVVRIPRIFIQSADPGAAASDGDLWIW